MVAIYCYYYYLLLLIIRRQCLFFYIHQVRLIPDNEGKSKVSDLKKKFGSLEVKSVLLHVWGGSLTQAGGGGAVWPRFSAQSDD